MERWQPPSFVVFSEPFEPAETTVSAVLMNPEARSVGAAVLSLGAVQERESVDGAIRMRFSDRASPSRTWRIRH